MRRSLVAVAVVLAVLGAVGLLTSDFNPLRVLPDNRFVLTSQAEVFSRPWIAGCLSGTEVYLGGRGMLARYDGDRWQRARLSPAVDVRAVACRDGALVGVGAAGQIVRADNANVQVSIERVADSDLLAVAFLDDGTAYVVGNDETIVTRRNDTWNLLRRSPAGRTWFSISARSAEEIWLGTTDATVVVFDGRSFQERLIPEFCFNGKDRCGHDVTAIARYGPRMAVAAARVYAFPPSGDVELVWKPGTEIRSLYSPGGERIYVVADDGLTVVRGVAPHHTAETNLPQGLDCPLRAVFGGDGHDVWLLAAGDHSGLAHFDGAIWRTIQGC